MTKKSATKKIRRFIYPAAFILIIILSALYKFVFKGSGDVLAEAFKSGKRAVITDSSEAVTDVSSSEEWDTEGTTMPSSEASSEPSETKEYVSVYICGEVNVPGIYEAPKGVMLNEIIEDAGGLTESASANNINLVYRIECNMSIYIPSKEEIKDGFSGGDIIRSDGVYVWGTSSGGSGQAGQPSGNSDGNVMVNINTATVDELKTLPGIGDVTAQAIVDYRKNAPFKTIEDIKNVSGIGDSKYSRIKDHICV